MRELKSESERGNILSGQGGTGGHISSSFTDLSDLSVDEDLRCASFESDNERLNLSAMGHMAEVGVVIPDGDKVVEGTGGGGGGGADPMENEGREPPVGVGSGVLQFGVPGGVPP